MQNAMRCCVCVCVYMCVCVCVCICPCDHFSSVLSFKHVQIFAILQTVACQDPLSMRFLRQEYWSGLQFPPPGDLSNPGIKPTSLVSPQLAGGFFTTSATWEALVTNIQIFSFTLESFLLSILPHSSSELTTAMTSVTIDQFKMFLKSQIYTLFCLKSSNLVVVFYSVIKLHYQGLVKLKASNSLLLLFFSSSLFCILSG